MACLSALPYRNHALVTIVLELGSWLTVLAPDILACADPEMIHAVCVKDFQTFPGRSVSPVRRAVPCYMYA